MQGKGHGLTPTHFTGLGNLILGRGTLLPHHQIFPPAGWLRGLHLASGPEVEHPDLVSSGSSIEDVAHPSLGNPRVSLRVGLYAAQ